MGAITFTVFTKPWRTGIPELGKHVAALGFDGIELPVRPGYPVNPENVVAELPRAAQILAGFGLRIASIAGPTDEQTIAACAQAGVPVIRICENIRPEETYLEAEARMQQEYDALVPVLGRHGVALGIQNHCDRCVANASALRGLVGRYSPRHIAVVWDAAHNALNGEEPELALDIIGSHLRMVNLKNAIWERTNGPEAPQAQWRHYWTTGRHGLASWPRVAADLKRRGYAGPVCLTAEYTDEAAVDRLIAEDLAYAKSLFE